MTSEFGPLLRRLRHEAGITQEGLAERAGVGVRTVRGLESGERVEPRVTTVRLLADALGLAPEEREELLAAVSAPYAEPVARRRGSVLDESLADVAEQVAQTVAARWRSEEEQWQAHGPYPLPLRWRSVPEELTDHWANIRRLPAGGTHGPLDLSGRLDEIVDVYRRIPSGRLVVLGRSGSGKTFLTVRFVLNHLRSRARSEAVPVIFRIGSWDPNTISFRGWLAAQLTRDHPGLAARGPGGSSLAAALVEAGWVLPVLDGFDEIADGLRRPALEALNATTLPLLLTSRPSEYAAAVAETDVLTSAAAVELTDLGLTDLADYLPRTTRKARGGGRPSATAWDPVLSELRERPHSQAAANLAAVLTTPLMVTLARAVYSDTPDHDPAALLDTRRFRTPEELEDHLLDNFTATVYRPRPGHLPGNGARRTFDPERAQYWLGYLAHHLTRLDTPDLEWWRLGYGMRRTARTLVTALVICLVIGFVDGAVGALFAPLGFQPVDGPVAGLLAGLMFGTLYWFGGAAKDASVAPSGVRMTIVGRAGKTRRRILRRVAVGLLCGLVFGFGYGFVTPALTGVLGRIGLPAGLRLGLDYGVIYGLVFALGAGATFGLLTLFETPLDIRSAVDPVGLLRTSRRTVAAQLLILAPTFGLLVALGVGLVVRPLSGVLGSFLWTPTAALKLGVTSGLGAALGYGLGLTAWGQWVVFARIWLPLTGRLPWSLVAFLEDAHQRGVLRQAGAVYQFRHPRLQHHLARAYRGRQVSGLRGGRRRRLRNGLGWPRRVFYRWGGGGQAHSHGQRHETVWSPSRTTARSTSGGGYSDSRRSSAVIARRPRNPGSGAGSVPGLRPELRDLSAFGRALPDVSGGPPVVGGGSSRTGGPGSQQNRFEGGEGERRRLVAELAEHTAAGEEVPLQVQIVAGGGSRGAPLRLFPVPETGVQLLITVHAPALIVTPTLQQEVTVLPGRDSDVLRFGIRANQPGLHEVTVRAFRVGTFLGEVRCQISVDPGGASRGGPQYSTELETLAFDPGEVTLQVLRNGPGSFTFQLLSETCYAPVTYQAGNPHEAAARIHHELKEFAAKASRADANAEFPRRRLRAHGVQLWESAVPLAVQHQFWEQSRRITSFTILGEHDVIPWELLYPLNEGQEDRGFLCEWLPVVRRVFGQDRVRELALSTMAFVVPPGSPKEAGKEVDAVRARLAPALNDPIVPLTEREELTNRLEDGLGGLLHFACHNAFTAAGSKVAMADGPFAPIDLAAAAQLRSLRAEHPLVFFNACSSAGEIDWFGETLGWAPQFLRAGAGAFIGTLWPVRSDSARDFADAFYDQLITRGKPLGQASLAARQAIRSPDGDPTWLAYAVYGSPAATAHTRT
ncbi:CHAT domain-containing protein [Streptomyces noursei]|uniref:CHAT domain-containing protein n=1 Tax=Streptomyces noursei TaxID=1971 RepID=UPI0037F1DB19